MKFIQVLAVTLLLTGSAQATANANKAHKDVAGKHEDKSASSQHKGKKDHEKSGAHKSDAHAKKDEHVKKEEPPNDKTNLP